MSTATEIYCALVVKYQKVNLERRKVMAKLNELKKSQWMQDIKVAGYQVPTDYRTNSFWYCPDHFISSTGEQLMDIYLSDEHKQEMLDYQFEQIERLYSNLENETDPKEINYLNGAIARHENGVVEIEARPVSPLGPTTSSGVSWSRSTTR